MKSFEIKFSKLIYVTCTEKNVINKKPNETYWRSYNLLDGFTKQMSNKLRV